MPPALPVPSKGALRALRQIALGTSCTVAFGAGLITEDRRRRIQSASEVSENARRIKASRRYHSTGASAAATFEEQIEGYCHNGPWKGGDKQRSLELIWNDKPPDITSQTRPKDDSGYAGDFTRQHVAYSTRRPSFINAVKDVAKDWQLPKALTIKLVSGRAPAWLQILPPDQHAQIAREVLNILQDGSSLEMLQLAAAALSSALADCLPLNTEDDPLLHACILFARTCERHDHMDLFSPMVEKFIDCGTLSDQEFYALRLPIVISQLLKESGYRQNRPGLKINDLEKLRQAVAMYVTRFPGKSEKLPLEMLKIGTQLSIATTRANLYDLHGEIHQYLLSVDADNIYFDTESLILIYRAREDHKKVLDYFGSHFPDTKLSQSQFYAVVDAAVQSALDLKRLDEAEKVLLIATQMAEANKLRNSTKWSLQILGGHWRTKQNLDSTQALFRRLETSIKLTSHPQAVFSAMIQFCIEAGSEDDAKEYLDRYRETGGDESLDIRTRGHLALAKAMNNDWTGVEDAFKAMKRLFPSPSPDYTAVFIPIFKLFATSHQTSQIEEFLRYYIEKLDIIPDQYVSNIMLGVYCKSGELKCIPAWIEYAETLGLNFNAVSFNIILTKCRRMWGVQFDDLYAMCESVKAISSTMIDATTIRILRGAAIVQQAHSNSSHAGKLLKKVESLQRVTKCPISNNIDIRMREALAQGRPRKALETYQREKSKDMLITPQVVVLAVRASLQTSADGDPGPAMDLLVEARSRGVDVGPSMTKILLCQMERVNKELDLDLVVVRTLAAFDERGLRITLPIATRFVSALVDRGLSREAIALWNSLLACISSLRQSIDIAILTVLLKAYVALKDFNGIQWVIGSLSRNQVCPDRHFKSVLKNARGNARRYAEAHPNHHGVRKSYLMLDESLKRVTDMRTGIKLKQREAEDMTLKLMETAALASNRGRIERAEDAPRTGRKFSSIALS